MRKLILLGIISLITLSFTIANTGNSDIDKKLVGSWKGFEKNNQVEGIEKHWIQHRFENGKFVTLFTTVENCEVKTFKESGKWWVKDGKFYEQPKTSKSPDVYNYEVVDDLVVKFSMLKSEENFDNPSYQFEDYKIVD